MHILDKESEGLADKLQALPLERRRQIVAEACNLAGRDIGDLEPEIQDLLSAISLHNLLSDLQVEQARSLANKADDKYFTLQEDGAAESEYLNWFSKSRLLTAIADGFQGSSWEKAADAIYELCHAADDRSKIIALVESEIGK